MAELCCSHYRLPFPLQHSDLHTPVIITSLDLEFVLRISSSALGFAYWRAHSRWRGLLQPWGTCQVGAPSWDDELAELLVNGTSCRSSGELARLPHLLRWMRLLNFFSWTCRRAAYHCIKKRKKMDIVPLQTTLNTSQDQSPLGIQEEEKPKLQNTDQDQPQQPWPSLPQVLGQWGRKYHVPQPNPKISAHLQPGPWSRKDLVRLHQKHTGCGGSK